MARQKIIHMKTSVPGRVPTAESIEVGEIAINLPDRQLYSKDGDGTVFPLRAEMTAADKAKLDSKLDASALPANRVYFMTDAVSDVAGYNKLVDDVHDPDFPATHVEYESVTLTATDALIGAFITQAFTSHVHNDTLPVTIVGACKRSSGNADAIVRFELYKRTAGGVETKVAESSGVAVSLGDYTDISDSAFIPHIELDAGDRMVIKYFAKKYGLGSGPKIKYRMGDGDPMRALITVPITAVLPELADVAYSGDYNDLQNRPPAGGAQLPAEEQYSYANGLITKIESDLGDTDITYNPDGSVASIEYPSGRIETYTYSAAGNVISMEATE